MKIVLHYRGNPYLQQHWRRTSRCHHGRLTDQCPPKGPTPEPGDLDWIEEGRPENAAPWCALKNSHPPAYSQRDSQSQGHTEPSPLQKPGITQLNISKHLHFQNYLSVKRYLFRRRRRRYVFLNVLDASYDEKYSIC